MVVLCLALSACANERLLMCTCSVVEYGRDAARVDDESKGHARCSCERQEEKGAKPRAL
jgi:hypothetical protein